MCFFSKNWEKNLHGVFLSYFYLIKASLTAVRLLIDTPCGAQKMKKINSENLWVKRAYFFLVNGLYSVSVSRFIIVSSAYFVSHRISHLFFHFFLSSFAPLSLSFFCLDPPPPPSPCLSPKPSTWRLIPLVSNTDNHGNRPQLLSSWVCRTKALIRVK